MRQVKLSFFARFVEHQGLHFQPQVIAAKLVKRDHFFGIDRASKIWMGEVREQNPL